LCIRTLNSSEAAAAEFDAKVEEAIEVSGEGPWVRPRTRAKECSVTLTKSEFSGTAVPVSGWFSIVDGSRGLVPAFVPTPRRMRLAEGVSSRGKATELHEAVGRGDTVEIWRFAGRAALINAKDEKGCSPMAWAALTGNLPALRALFTLGGDVNAVTDEGASVLLLAAQNGHLASVRFLADHDADVGLANKDQMAPVHVSTQGGHVAIVRELLERRVSINAVTCDGSLR
jgi:hypothetical protein